MEIYIEQEEKTVQLNEKKITVSELLKKLKINKSTVLVVRNDSLIADDAILNTKDNIKLLSVVSGG